MNIALFLDCFKPMKNGVITSALQLKEGLELKGHKVFIFSVKVDGYDNIEKDIFLFPQITLDFGSKQGFGIGIVNQRKLNKIIKENKIDIIHTHTEFFLGFAGKKASLKMNIPRIVTTHTMWEQYDNYMPLLKIKSLVRMFLKQYIKKSNYIISPSIKAKKYYELFDDKINKTIIPNGINSDKFINNLSEYEKKKILEKYNILEKDKIILFIGRIGKEKRVVDLLNSLKKLLIKYDNIKMVFVGDGPDLNKLKEISKINNLEKKVIFTGFVDWSEISNFYAVSSVFVSASLSEVHPMTLIEAIISGLPAIVRRDESYMDLVFDDKNGYLVDHDNEIPEKIEQIIFNNDLLTNFSKNSLEISKNFSVDNHISKIEKIYMEVLKKAD